jgi:pimeloyl-ACP methyl ester carboxylesterase
MKTHWFFLRGLIRESGHWDGFLERVQAALPEVKVVALDLPGAGARFREKSPASIGAMAAAMRPAFLERKGEENYLFALSLGAMVGIQWMLDYPSDWQGAVLANTSLKGLNPFHQRLLPKNYGKILRLLPADAARKERTILEMTSHRESEFDRIQRDWVKIRGERPVSPMNALRQLLAAARFYLPNEKPKARVLLLNSAKDDFVSPYCSERIARHWNLPLHTHPEAGHDIALDAPEWVLEEIRKFQP